MLNKIVNAPMALLALVLVVVIIVAAAILVGLGHPVPTWFVTIALTGLATSLGHATVTTLAASTPAAPTAAAPKPQVAPPHSGASEALPEAPSAVQPVSSPSGSVLDALSGQQSS